MTKTVNTLQDYTYVAAEIFRHVPRGKHFVYYDLPHGNPDPSLIHKHTGALITPKSILAEPHTSFWKRALGKELFSLALVRPRRVPVTFDIGEGQARLTDIVANTLGNVSHAAVNLASNTAFVDTLATPYFNSLGFTCVPAETLYTIPFSSPEGQIILEAMLTGTPVYGQRSEDGIRTSSGNFYPAGI